MTDEAQVFGAVLLEQGRIMRRLVGDDVFERALGNIDPARREEYESLQLLGWCRASTATAVTKAVAIEAGEDPAEFVHSVVKAGFGVVLRTLWRVLMRFSSNEALVRRAGTLYSKAVNKGTMRARQIVPGKVELTMSGWPEADDLDLIALHAGVEAALLAVRREVVVSHHRTQQGARFLIELDRREKT